MRRSPDDSRSRCWEVYLSQRTQFMDIINLLKGQSDQLDSKIKRAFYQPPRNTNLLVACPDGRVKKDRKIGLLASGALLTDSEIKITTQKIKERYPNNKILVGYHDFCLAAHLKAEELFEKGEQDTSAERIAYWAADRLDKNLRGDGVVKIGFYSDSQFSMCGFYDFHHEGLIVLAGKGFSPRLLGLPPCFYHSVWACPDDEYIKKEFEVGLGVVLGDQGFGRGRFRGENKLPVIICGHRIDSDCSVDRYLDIVEPIIQRDEYRDHVELISFVSPV